MNGNHQHAESLYNDRILNYSLFGLQHHYLWHIPEFRSFVAYQFPNETSVPYIQDGNASQILMKFEMVSSLEKRWDSLTAH